MTLKEEYQFMQDEFNRKLKEKTNKNKELDKQLNTQVLEIKKEYGDLFIFIVKLFNTLKILVEAYFSYKKKLHTAKLYIKWQKYGFDKLNLEYLTYGNQDFETQLKKDEKGIIHTIEYPKIHMMDKMTLEQISSAEESSNESIYNFSDLKIDLPIIDSLLHPPKPTCPKCNTEGTEVKPMMTLDSKILMECNNHEFVERWYA